MPDWVTPQLVIQAVTTLSIVLIAVDKWVHRQVSDTKALHERLDRTDERMDRAGELMSDLATTIQGLEERFVTRRETEWMQQEALRERARINHEIEALWSTVRRNHP